MDVEMLSVRNTIHQYPGISALKAIDSKFIFVNETISKLAGFKCQREMEGKGDEDCCESVAMHAHIFKEHDAAALKANAEISVIDIVDYKDSQITVVEAIHKPFKDNSGKIIGVLATGQIITDRSYIGIGHAMMEFAEGKQSLDRPRNRHFYNENDLIMLDYNLTSRQAEVLFYLIRGNKPKLIARKLNISVKTVEKHITNLRSKFSECSTSQLVENTIDKGYLYLLPKRILKRKNVKLLLEFE